ncbi:hypothetical protein SAMN05444487_10321 [Marininema mesophilum]|uniref:Uncharacterized protein n=1 Tax=Marininema mesophilum TaxID=1048340 RepID=A0A1H2T482_9BACL|nr:hypothetical protein [Marininema mesophilum]SDW38607.1 hypothetical protein SAMN05444487_10321 [Marininema mesophilum]
MALHEQDGMVIYSTSDYEGFIVQVEAEVKEVKLIDSADIDLISAKVLS